MTPERWQQVKEVLHGALELAPEQRSAFLDNACSADQALRQDVESLLASSDESRSGFLHSSAAPVTLAKGTRLGDYEVQSLLGSGGMGEVYRAHDRRLDRDVAIKVLPAFLSSDPDRLRRFEQEARAAAALNHPNILAVLQMGTYEGAPYLVSELLDGLTLREHLRRGPLPIRKATDCAIQIAHGLAAAHDKSIVHRDLKPENLFVTKDGRIKILDFGLAKLTQPKAGSIATARTLDEQTEPGVVMGTVGYMSPEQVRGEAADHRADVFAFGAILYEMLTGKRAFQEATAVETMGAILKDDPPPVTDVVPAIPPGLQRIVHRCLEKDRDQRFRTASDLAFALESLSDLGVAVPNTAAVRPVGQRFRRLVGTTALLAALLLAFALALWHPWRSSPAPAVIRFPIIPPEKTAFGFGLAVSPDGQQVAFVAERFNQTTLGLRALNSSEPKLLSGTEGALFPFWSPDGAEIGFFAGGKLKKIDLRSGAVQTLADASEEGRGGDWNGSGDIIFAPSTSSALFRISANGGNASPVTVLDASKGETSHRWPHFLPDGHHFTFLARAISRDAEMTYIASLNTRERQELFAASSEVEFAQPGYLLFVRGRTLFAQPFNQKKLRVVGEPIAILDGLQPESEEGPTYFAAFDVNGGVLAYGKTGGRQVQLAWWDRNGKKLQDIPPPGMYDEPALSSDGSRVALDVVNVLTLRNSVWVLDVARGALSRLSFEDRAVSPIWSPDGQQIAYRMVEKNGNAYEFSIIARPSSGAGNITTLIRQSSQEQAESLFPDSWSPDGRILIIERADPAQGNHIALWRLPLNSDHKLQPFLSAPFNQTHATFSPDGRWLAYSSDETGRSEVYVQDFPGRTRKVQISTSGGDQALWGHKGKELFFLSGERDLMVVNVEQRGELNAGAPHVLFHAPIQSGGLLGPHANYAIAPDGKRILLNVVREGSVQPNATVVVNWSSELRK